MAAHPWNCTKTARFGTNWPLLGGAVWPTLIRPSWRGFVPQKTKTRNDQIGHEGGPIGMHSGGRNVVYGSLGREDIQIELNGMISEDKRAFVYFLEKRDVLSKLFSCFSQ